jgi:hypothetical protein
MYGRKETLGQTLLEPMSDLELKFSEQRTTLANQHTRTPILLRGKSLNLRAKTLGRSHPNLVPLL